MSTFDQVFWWIGAVVASCSGVMVASLFLYGAGLAVKKVCGYWWDRTLTIYRLESLRHYFKIMVDNGRAGLLKEVEESRAEAAQRGDREVKS